jgi:hypothetical protein
MHKSAEFISTLTNQIGLVPALLRNFNDEGSLISVNTLAHEDEENGQP